MEAKKQIKQGVEVLEIYPKILDQYWNLCEFMLREGLKYDGNPMSIEDLKEYIKNDKAGLFMMFGSDDGVQYKVFGVCVGRIAELPNYSQYEIIICTGKRRELWEDNLVKEITNFAKLNKCKRMCIMARPGWEKVSKKWGWQKKHVQLEKWI